MTSAENWELVKLRRNDGGEIEARQFKPVPEEERLRAQLAANANANLRRLNIRHRIQLALLALEKSTPEFLREAIEWAKTQPPVTEAASSGDEDNYDVEWNRRAVVMTAALAAREYEGDNREDVLSWARPILHAASAQTDKEYLGNNQVEYNTKAIAALGLVSFYVRERDAATRNIILGLAGYEHPLHRHRGDRTEERPHDRTAAEAPVHEQAMHGQADPDRAHRKRADEDRNLHPADALRECPDQRRDRTCDQNAERDVGIAKLGVHHRAFDEHSWWHFLVRTFRRHPPLNCGHFSRSIHGKLTLLRRTRTDAGYF